MEESDALPDGSWLQLWRGSARDTLRHNGTGGLVPLAARCTLHVEDEWGLCRSEADDGETLCEWAQDLLNSSLHRDATGELYISTESEGATVRWQSVVFELDSAARVIVLRPTVGDFVSEVFISDLRRGTACVRWSVPYLLTWLFGPTFNAQWFSKRARRFEQYIIDFGFETEDWRPSRAAISCRHRSASEGSAPMPSLVGFDQDFSVSTRGLFALLLSLYTSKSTEDLMSPLNTSILQLMTCLVERFVGAQGEVTFVVDPAKQLVGTVRNRIVAFDAPILSGLTSPRLPFQAGIPMAEAMVLLQSYASRPSKTRFAGDAAAALRCLSEIVHADVEAAREDASWASASHALLPRLGGETRARRVPLGAKLGIAAEVSAELGVRSVQQFIAAQKLQDRLQLEAEDEPEEQPAKRKRRTAIAELKSTLAWHHDRMLAYMATGRLALSGTQVLGISVDGSRVGNRELQMCGAWAADKVVRDTRLRADAPGAAFTSEEKTAWRCRTADFVAERKAVVGANAKAKAKASRLDSQFPRMAAKDFLSSLDHALRVGLDNVSLRTFLSEPMEWDQDLKPGEDIGPVMVLTMDQHQVQWCGLHFLARKFHASITGIPGPFHRRHNDWGRALSRSSFLGTYLRMVIVANIGYGPWQGGAFHQNQTEASLDLMQSMEPDDPFIMAFWDQICSDHDWQEPHQRSSSARKEFLSTLSATKCLLSKGPKAAMSRWFSVLHAWTFLDDQVHTKLFILAFLCCMNGWCANYASLKLSSPAQKSVQAPSSSAAAGGSASSSSAAVVRKAVNEEKSQVLKSSKNTLHAVAKYLADDTLISEARAIQLVGGPLQREHSHWAKTLGSVQSVVHDYSDCALLGTWCGTMRQTIATMSDLGALRRVGFNVGFAAAVEQQPSEDELGVEDGLANSLWRLQCYVLTERCSSMMMHVGSYPLALAGILNDNHGKANECLMQFKKDWEMYSAAREVRHPVWSAMVRRCTLSLRSVQDLARLARADGWVLDGRLRTRVRLMFSTWGQEQMIEKTFQKLRDVETRDTSSKTLRNWRAWEVAVSSGIMGSSDRLGVVANNTIVTSDWSPDVDIFERAGPTSCEQTLQAILKAQDWDTFSAQTEKKLPAELSLLRRLASTGEEILCEKAWVTCVLPLHQIILFRQTDDSPKEMFFTIWVSEVGALTWPVVKLGAGVMKLDTSPEAAPSWQWLFRLAGVQVVPLQPLSPLHSYFKRGVGMEHASIMVQISKPVNVMEFQAKRGFAGIGEYFLKKLHEEAKITLPQASSDIGVEDNLALNLVHKVLPDIDASEFKTIMRHRIQYNDEGIRDESCNDALDTDVLLDVSTRNDQKVASEFKSDVAKMRNRREKAVVQCDKVILELLPPNKRKVLENPATKLANKQKIHTAKGRERWWANVVGETSFLKEWAPPESRIVQDLPNGRWLVSMSGRDRRSISWTKRGSSEAVSQALRVLWEWHCQSTGDICPIPGLLSA